MSYIAVVVFHFVEHFPQTSKNVRFQFLWIILFLVGAVQVFSHKIPFLVQSSSYRDR